MLTEARLSVTFSTAEDILKAEDTEKGFLFFFFFVVVDLDFLLR